MITQPRTGTRIKTTKLGETTGMLIVQRHLDARATGITGTISGWVPGHGGDVWWVQHDDSADIGAYSIDEMEYADIQETATNLVGRIESALASLNMMAMQARGFIDISTDMDINTLTLVIEKLEQVEDAWSSAHQIADGARRMADAADEHDTQADALGAAVQ